VSRIGGLVRVAHPFPSTLDALVTGVLATVAGASPGVALRLAIAMLVIQAGIGAANDVVDASSDAAAKPSKPIPDGLVSRTEATVAAGLFAGAGLLLAATVSPAAFGLGLLGAFVGFAYDLRLKGTAWSWLPFAIGIPILPLFAWIGAAGSVPAPVLVLTVLAAPAGAAIAIANALPDLERDGMVGVRSVATLLGRERAVRVVAILQTVVGVTALVTYSAIDAPLSIGPGLFGVALSCVGLWAGAMIGSRPEVRWRQRAWEIQAISTGALAATWVGGLAAGGRF
jgi:4-hydroxybenzoate polyprenyltransferase